MRLLNNLKIGTRLTLIFIIIVGLTLGGFIYLIVKTRVINHELDSIYNKHLKSIDYLLQADRDAYQSSISISQSLTSYGNSTPEIKKKLKTGIQENIDQVDERYGYFEDLSPIIITTENKTKNEEFHALYKKVKEYTDLIISNIENNNLTEAEKI